MIVNDTPEGYAVKVYVNATDKFMSGWGRAPGLSYYCVACDSYEVAEDVERRMGYRDDFKRVMLSDKPRTGGASDHTHIVPASQFTYQPKFN